MPYPNNFPPVRQCWPTTISDCIVGQAAGQAPARPAGNGGTTHMHEGEGAYLRLESASYLCSRLATSTLRRLRVASAPFARDGLTIELQLKRNNPGN